jgi:hypothetical protein
VPGGQRGPDGVRQRERLRPADLDDPVRRRGAAASATTAATSPAAAGWNSRGVTRTTPSRVYVSAI